MNAQFFADCRRNARVAAIYSVAWLNRRWRPRVKVVGITGSAGKTTTKRLCTAMLATFGEVQYTPRSKNERLPVALAIGGLRRLHRFCALEISGNKPGYLDLQMHIAKPDVGVLTLVARDHYSAFKSVEAIAREKAKIVTMLPPHGVAVLNADDPLVREAGQRCNRRVVWVGESAEAEVRLLEARSNWPEPLVLRVAVHGKEYTVTTRLHGVHLALSVLATLGVALALELPIDRAIAAIATEEPEDGRMQLVETDDGLAFVRDDWKASGWSIDAPFRFMRDARARRKIAVIGTISDSPLSPSRRYPRAARAARSFVELVLVVGPDAHHALKARENEEDASILAFASLRDAARFLDDALSPGDLVLLKGTNKQDHLARLIFDRQRRVSCWRADCALPRFCDRCSRLYADPVPIQLEGSGAGHDEGVRVVVGLGNPGEQYADTPHNVGHAVLDRLAASMGGHWQEELEGAVCRLEPDGVSPIILFKPAALMNLSGAPVAALLRRVGGGPERLIVVHDDLDFDLGAIRLKHDGGAAGHKGVLSVITELGCTRFRRVRVGVRVSGETQPAHTKVLARFDEIERAAIAGACEQAVARILETLNEVPSPRDTGMA